MKAFYLLSLAFCSSIIATPPTWRLPQRKVKVNTTDLNKPKTVSTETHVDLTEVCTTKKMQHRAGGDESILLDPQSDIIYPGAVIDAPTIESGEFRELGGDRGPLTLSISIPMEKASETVKSPTLSTVREAIKKIITSKALTINPAQFAVSCNEIYTKEQMKLVISGKYSAGFGSVEAGFNFDDTSVKTRYLLDLTQVYYSIDVNRMNPDNIFKSKPNPAPSFSPVYVSSVKYGRRVLVFIESNQNIHNQEANLKTQIKGLFASGSLNANSTLQSFFNERAINILTIGGNPKTGYQMLKQISDSKPIYDQLELGAVLSDQNPGSPLSYTLRYCTDGSIFTAVKYDEYTSRTCETKPGQSIELPIADLAKFCANPDGGGDREFGGHGPEIWFDITLHSKDNDIYARVECRWKETKDNYTSCSVLEDRKIVSVPSDKVLTGIDMPKQLALHKTLDGHGDHSFDKNDFGQNSFIRNLIVIGDTDDDDDPWVRDCNEEHEHTQIKRISFYPLKVTVTNRN